MMMMMSHTLSRSITDYGEEEEESVTQSWDCLFSNLREETSILSKQPPLVSSCFHLS